MWLILLLACAPRDLAGGQSGTEDRHDPESPGDEDGCVELSRGPVDDLAAPVEGLDYAAQDVIDALFGAWTGTLTRPAGDGVPATMSLEWTGAAIEARVMEPAPDVDAEVDCPSYYAIPTALGFATDDGAFAESVDPLVYSAGADVASFDASVALDELAGTDRPDFDAGAYAYVSLFLHAAGADQTWTVALTWSGYDEDGVVVGEEEGEVGQEETGGTVDPPPSETGTPVDEPDDSDDNEVIEDTAGPDGAGGESSDAGTAVFVR